jgi:hypothetical protein
LRSEAAKTLIFSSSTNGESAKFPQFTSIDDATVVVDGATVVVVDGATVVVVDGATVVVVSCVAQLINKVRKKIKDTFL